MDDESLFFPYKSRQASTSTTSAVSGSVFLLGRPVRCIATLSFMLSLRPPKICLPSWVVVNTCHTISTIRTFRQKFSYTRIVSLASYLYILYCETIIFSNSAVRTLLHIHQDWCVSKSERIQRGMRKRLEDVTGDHNESLLLIHPPAQKEVKSNGTASFITCSKYLAAHSRQRKRIDLFYTNTHTKKRTSPITVTDFKHSLY